MTLGSWFRDYVYIPMGGNKVSVLKWIRNIFVVWFLTGFWHGAGWNFIVWGLMFAILLLFEKFFFLGENAIFNRKRKAQKIDNETEKEDEKIIEKKSIVSIIWRGVKSVSVRVYVLFFLLISWMIFDASTLSQAFSRINVMLGLSNTELVNNDTIYYLRSYATVFIIGIIGCTPLLKNIILKIKSNKTGKRIVNILEPVVQIALFTLTTAYLIDGSFNPFLYFRF